MTLREQAMGRPSSYRQEYPEQVFELGLLGHTDDEMAQFFKVSIRTFNNWKKKHPEFMQSLKDGKTPADGKVVRKLYLEALDGNVTAMIYWLKNRQPSRWRDKPPESYSDTAPPQTVVVKIQGASIADSDTITG